MRIAASLAGLLLVVSSASAAGQDFDDQVDALLLDFPGAVHDTTALEDLDDRVDTLRDRIRGHRRENRSALSDEERDHLSTLVDVLRAYDGVITVVGQLGNSASVEVEGFERVNRDLGLEWVPVHEDPSGIAVVRVAVGSYHSYLIRNETGGSFVVHYAYRTPGMESAQAGIGSSLCGTLTVLSSLLNTRDKGDLSGLEFTQFRTTPMGAMASVGECG